MVRFQFDHLLSSPSDYSAEYRMLEVRVIPSSPGLLNKY